MKRVVSSIILVLSVAFSNSQTFGAKAGANIANVMGNDGEYNSFKIGFHIGGFAKIGITDEFFVQPELLYSLQGWNVYESAELIGSSWGPNTQTSDSFSLHYINLPIMAKYYVLRKLSFELGPQFGFMAVANETLTYTVPGSSPEEVTRDVSNNFNPIDFAVCFGAGYNITEKIGVGFRFNIGVTDISKENEGDAMTNSVFMLSLSYAFAGK